MKDVDLGDMICSILYLREDFCIWTSYMYALIASSHKNFAVTLAESPLHRRPVVPKQNNVCG